MRVRLIAALFVLAIFATSANAQEVLYGADGAGGNSSANLYILNPANGAVVTTVGPIGFAVTGLAVDPTTGILYGVSGRETGTASLITINRTTGAGTLVGVLDPVSSDGVPDITFTSDGTLYGFLGGGGDFDLATISKTTGLATVVGDAGLTGMRGNGLAASAADVLFLAGQGDGPLRTVNRSTGATTAGPTMNGTSTDRINALAFNAGGTLFGVQEGQASRLVTINTGTGVITDLGPTVSGLDAIVFDDSQAGADVPSLSEWMLLALALTLGGIGFTTFRTR